MNKRIIHTGLYTERAKTLLEKALDAIRLRSHSYRFSKNVSEASIVINPDNEIVIEANLDRYGYCRTIWDKSIGNDCKPKEWLAVNIKAVVRNSFKSDASWNRQNDDSEHYVETLIWYDDDGNRHDFTVAEAYLIYDVLLNRKNLTKKYPEELLNRIIGKQNDPLKTEMERVRREKLAEAKFKFTEEKNRIYCEMQEKLRKIREQYQAEADEATKKATELYAAEVAEIERKASSINRVSPLFAGIAS